MPTEPTRVLITGAGGPAGVAVIRSLQRDPAVDVIAADMDRYAAGLYLVVRDHRWLVPAGADEGFVDELLALCREARVDVLIPTVDAELLPISTHRDRFAAAGVRLVLTGDEALRLALDKLALVRRCAPIVRTPRTEVLGPEVDPASWTYPIMTKPRIGSGSRGIVRVESAAALAAMPHDDRVIVQEYLPGEEFSLDVLADLDSRVVAVVPRSRLRVDSGVSVAGCTLHDDELDALARGVVSALGLTLVANVQCRRDEAGRPSLLEVNPRFPGAMPLTVYSGVDMPRLGLDAVLGRPLPRTIAHTDQTMVRFLDERFLESADLALLSAAVAV